MGSAHRDGGGRESWRTSEKQSRRQPFSPSCKIVAMERMTAWADGPEELDEALRVRPEEVGRPQPEPETWR